MPGSPSRPAVARPFEMRSTSNGLPILVSALVSGDTAPPNWNAVGRLFARLHGLPRPPWLPTHPVGVALADLLAERLGSRMASLRKLRPELPRLPSRAEMAARITADSRAVSLLHLDIRPSNLMHRGGRILALIDWSNALIGDRRLEVARISEYAQVGENEIDEAAFLAGYCGAGGALTDYTPTDILYRLDAAVMLALLFLAVVPKPDLAPGQVKRVALLAERLAGKW